NGGKNSLNRLIRCVCGKKIGPDPRNFNQRVCLGRNDLLIRTFLRKRLGYEVLSFSLQAHSLSQECIDKLDIFFADDLFKYESVCIAAMEHLKSKATAPI
ncbi:hypothetical protein NXZ12_08295, partial [Escherichia coli]|nr:hypothetical protein [Escherichia coli]